MQLKTLSNSCQLVEQISIVILAQNNFSCWTDVKVMTVLLKKDHIQNMSVQQWLEYLVNKGSGRVYIQQIPVISSLNRACSDQSQLSDVYNIATSSISIIHAGGDSV